MVYNADVLTMQRLLTHCHLKIGMRQANERKMLQLSLPTRSIPEANTIRIDFVDVWNTVQIKSVS